MHKVWQQLARKAIAQCKIEHSKCFCENVENKFTARIFLVKKQPLVQLMWKTAKTRATEMLT